ncbi:hypothetical protein F5148DRAFT_1283173 [Russula earlei]|uniref:Uncharacterized protein n=1 Tax=Russula earlei TaxID=71964 RepID=A0ACC0UCQ2_9AGAM|nr:hypothetical protein F5148DRAFT_1283173 [Russula earlei]
MEPPLLPGQYYITNVELGQSPGHDLTEREIKPIIGIDDNPIWVVEHVEGDRYRLTLNGFVTRPKDGIVWSYLSRGVVGAEWIIRQTADGSSYYVIDPNFRPTRIWTLTERDCQVSLGVHLIPEPLPNQRWLFIRLVDEQ